MRAFVGELACVGDAERTKDEPSIPSRPFQNVAEDLFECEVLQPLHRSREALLNPSIQYNELAEKAVVTAESIIVKVIASCCKLYGS